MIPTLGAVVHRPSERVRGLPRREWFALLLGGILLVSTIAAPPAVGPAGAPDHGTRADVIGAAGSLVLALQPSPELGNAPLNVNVSVTVSGGVGPYNLTLCFGLADHTSPPSHCGGGAAAWSGQGTLRFPHTYASAGNFSVLGIVSDARGGGVGSTALIVVTDRTALAATAAELTGSGTAPLAETFNETVAGGTPPITLQWEFGDGTSGSELPGVPVTHLYTSPGVFVPQLVVTDAAGHRTVRTLAPLTVAAGHTSRAGPSAVGEATVMGLLVGFVLAAILVALGVTLVVRSRWRDEGDALVATLRDETVGPPPGRPPP